MVTWRIFTHYLIGRFSNSRGLAMLPLLVASLGTAVSRSSQTIVGRHTRTRPWCTLTRLRISSETSTPRASSKPARLLPQDTA